MRGLVAVLLVGCAADGGHYPPGSPPIVPGSGGTQNPPDAATATADAGASAGGIVGGLCVVASVEVLTPCTPLAASGLTVTASETGASASVGDDGRFALPSAPGKSRITLFTSTTDATFFGSAVVASLGPTGTGVATVPVLRRAAVADLTVAAGVGITAGLGVLVVHTSSGATLDAIGGALPYYDAGGGLVTAQPPTGPEGVAIFFNLVGPVTTTVHVAGSARAVSATVVGDAINFIDARP